MNQILVIPQSNHYDSATPATWKSSPLLLQLYSVSLLTYSMQQSPSWEANQ